MFDGGLKYLKMQGLLLGLMGILVGITFIVNGLRILGKRISFGDICSFIFSACMFISGLGIAALYLFEGGPSSSFDFGCIGGLLVYSSRFFKLLRQAFRVIGACFLFLFRAFVWNGGLREGAIVMLGVFSVLYLSHTSFGDSLRDVSEKPMCRATKLVRLKNRRRPGTLRISPPARVAAACRPLFRTCQRPFILSILPPSTCRQGFALARTINTPVWFRVLVVAFLMCTLGALAYTIGKEATGSGGDASAQ